jgi:hypothetical protein
MNNTTEYERIFNMSTNERRQILKDKDQDFKKEYFAYDNRERARIRRQSKKTDEDNKDTNQNITISQDPLLNSNPKLFKQKIDELFKTTKINAQISNSNIDIVNEVINNPPKPEIIEQPNNPPTIPNKTDDNIVDDGVFCKKVVYADLVIAKDYICEGGEVEEQVSPDSIKKIKNYNIKIPVSYLEGVYINLPNNNSKIICDTEYVYIFI